MPLNGLPQGITNPPLHTLTFEEREAFSHDASSWMGPAPGTFVLVFVFLASFMTYFFVNWKVLSILWKIG